MKELRNIKTNGSASLSELQEFLGGLKGRSPQEVIGIVSTSMLIQSLIIAVVGTIIGMAVFTVLPYMLYGPLKSGPTAKVTPAAATGEKEPAGKPANESTAAADPSKPDVDKATKALGLDETKTADPNKNPLESNPGLDKLLDQ